MFDVGLGEMMVLVVLALVIFGDRLPAVAKQTGQTLRQLRTMANNAKQDLQEGLGPEFKDFDLEDLNPKRFVRKHLFEDDDGMSATDKAAENLKAAYTNPPDLLSGDPPPWDPEAT